jgi:hypothetical protein
VLPILSNEPDVSSVPADEILFSFLSAVVWLLVESRNSLISSRSPGLRTFTHTRGTLAARRIRLEALFGALRSVLVHVSLSLGCASNSLTVGQSSGSIMKAAECKTSIDLMTPRTGTPYHCMPTHSLLVHPTNRTMLANAAVLLTAVTASAIKLPSPSEVLSDAAKANMFMLTSPVDAGYHGGSTYVCTMCACAGGPATCWMFRPPGPSLSSRAHA